MSRLHLSPLPVKTGRPLFFPCKYERKDGVLTLEAMSISPSSWGSEGSLGHAKLCAHRWVRKGFIPDVIAETGWTGEVKLYGLDGAFISTIPAPAEDRSDGWGEW